MTLKTDWWVEKIAENQWIIVNFCPKCEGYLAQSAQDKDKCFCRGDDLKGVKPCGYEDTAVVYQVKKNKN